jgi:hypothetical protein
MSWILTYLMVGVAMIALYDYMCTKLETELRFNNRERFIVMLVWPIALVMLIWSFIKVLMNGPN